MDCTIVSIIAVITASVMLLIGLYQSRELNTANWQIEQLQQEKREAEKKVAEAVERKRTLYNLTQTT